MSNSKEPVTTSGWYENADESVTLYRWHDGRLLAAKTIASWAHVPEPDYSADDRASRAATRRIGR